jgi:hypothetical protein
MKEKDSVKAIAARCLKDPAFARQVLAGDDHPAVRSALSRTWKRPAASRML